MSLIIGSTIVPGTDWVRHDPAAWFALGGRGTRSRDGAVADIGLGHWTAGPCRTGEHAARRVVEAMRARKRDDGTPLDVGIHFVLSWDGLCFQTADLAIATVHVGNRRVIRRSIGVECCWPGTAAQARRLGIDGPYVAHRVLGRREVLMLPSEAMIATWCRLMTTLADLPPSTGVRIPPRVPAFGGSRRFTAAEQRDWSGGQEHLHVPLRAGKKRGKIDAGGLLVGALADCGWRRE